MDRAERLAQVEAALLRLRQVADGACILVEGNKDLVALQRLGIGGAHRTVNVRGTVQETIDSLVTEAEHNGWHQVILLLDWDRTGGRLMRRFRDGLAGQVAFEQETRQQLTAACHCRCFEDVPAELESLRNAVGRLL